MTLTEVLLPDRTRLTGALLVLGGSAVVALAAQVSVPMFPVPMTLQTLAVLLVGFALGARLGAAALLAYLAEGAVGLPVFSGGHGSVLWLLGPTGGFLLGFVGVAWLAGKAAERGPARGPLTTALAALAISALLYLPGLGWLMAVTGLGAGDAAATGMVPFLVGDVVKAVLAAMLVSGGLSALRRRCG